eukprot:PhM_4_TR18882/c0_g1_i1/m.76557/K15335/NSUN2; tRNA (cytosine34-C5)-methyltransferase
MPPARRPVPPYRVLEASAKKLLRVRNRKAFSVLAGNLHSKNALDPAILPILLNECRTRRSPDQAVLALEYGQHEGWRLTPSHYSLACAAGCKTEDLLRIFGGVPAELRSRATLPEDLQQRQNLPALESSSRDQSLLAVSGPTDLVPSVGHHHALTTSPTHHTSSMSLITSTAVQGALIRGYFMSQGIVQNAAEFMRLAKMLDEPRPTTAQVNTLLPYSAHVHRAVASLKTVHSFSTAGQVAHAPQTTFATTESRAVYYLNALAAQSAMLVHSASTALCVSLLGVKPHDVVLDMCAAPGNKSMLIAQALAGTGCAVLNDNNRQRLQKVIERVSSTPMPNVIVTQYDAAVFPSVGETFDCILADVQCSGDGRLLKDAHVWDKWSPMQGVRNHPDQINVLTRAVEMLAVGGTVMYSTCSLNPVENEAVVAAVLRRYGDALEVVNVHERQPGNVALAPGLTSWGVPTSATQVIKAPTTETHAAMLSSLFAPSETEVCSALQKCGRLYPQRNSDYTTGFFYALLRKKHSVMSEKQSSAKSVAKRAPMWRPIEGSPVEATWSRICATFGLPDPKSVAVSEGTDTARVCDSYRHGAVVCTPKAYDLQRDVDVVYCGCPLTDASGNLSAVGAQYYAPQMLQRVVRLPHGLFFALVSDGVVRARSLLDGRLQMRNAVNISEEKELAVTDVPWFEEAGLDTAGPVVVTAEDGPFSGCYINATLDIEKEETWTLRSCLAARDRNRVVTTMGVLKAMEPSTKTERSATPLGKSALSDRVYDPMSPRTSAIGHENTDYNRLRKVEPFKF